MNLSARNYDDKVSGEENSGASETLPTSARYRAWQLPGWPTAAKHMWHAREHHCRCGTVMIAINNNAVIFVYPCWKRGEREDTGEREEDGESTKNKCWIFYTVFLILESKKPIKCDQSHTPTRSLKSKWLCFSELSGWKYTSALKIATITHVLHPPPCISWRQEFRAKH